MAKHNSKQPNVTINWKNKTHHRGLSETAIEKLLEVGNKHTKKGTEDMLQKAADLTNDYEAMRLQSDLKRRDIYFKDELHMVEKYVRVLV
jgi:hypothetical protein